MGAACRRRAFTLIEVLIVVVIMAVLAATIIPQFASSTTDAKMSTLKYNSHALRSQIKVYRYEHLDAYPTIQNDDLPQLTSSTNAQGEIGPAGPNYPYGPYVAHELPVNSFDGSNKVSPVATPGQQPNAVVGNLGGWQYDVTTGAVWPNNAEYYP